MTRGSLLLSLLIAAALPLGCARTETYGPYVYPVIGSGITLISEREGSIVAIEPASGLVRWTYEFSAPPHPTYGAFYRSPLVCPVERSTIGLLLLAFENQVVALDSRDGTQRWSIPFHGGLPPVICPAVTPDSGVVVAYDAKFSSGVIVKYGFRGHRQWSYQPPDIGPLTRRIWADQKTGNIHIVSRTHLLGLSPRGELNWSRPTTGISPPAE